MKVTDGAWNMVDKYVNLFDYAYLNYQDKCCETSEELGHKIGYKRLKSKLRKCFEKEMGKQIHKSPEKAAEFFEKSKEKFDLEDFDEALKLVNEV